MHELRRPVLVAGLILIVQAALGMGVNLYVSVPARHPGAQPANYFAGSVRSVSWAITGGEALLAIHALLGLALAVLAIAVAHRAVALRAGWTAATLALAAALVVGAGFNGASFLDFGLDVSSLLMAQLSFAAACCYFVALYLLPARPAAEA